MSSILKYQVQILNFKQLISKLNSYYWLEIYFFKYFLNKIKISLIILWCFSFNPLYSFTLIPFSFPFLAISSNINSCTMLFSIFPISIISKIILFKWTFFHQASWIIQNHVFYLVDITQYIFLFINFQHFTSISPLKLALSIHFIIFSLSLITSSITPLINSISMNIII